jgi:hypothetical protein
MADGWRGQHRPAGQYDCRRVCSRHGGARGARLCPAGVDVCLLAAPARRACVSPARREAWAWHAASGKQTTKDSG